MWRTAIAGWLSVAFLSGKTTKSVQESTYFFYIPKGWAGQLFR